MKILIKIKYIYAIWRIKVLTKRILKINEKIEKYQNVLYQKYASEMIDKI